MLNIILFDPVFRNDLLPLAYTKPVCEFLVGITTIKAKWEHYLGKNTSYLTQDYLSDKYPIKYELENYYINGAVLPSDHLKEAILKLKPDEGLKSGLLCIAVFKGKLKLEDLDPLNQQISWIEYENKPDVIQKPWDIFRLNGQYIKSDYSILTKGRPSKVILYTNTVVGSENVFIEEGAKVNCAIINALNGPVYIGKHSEIMEGAIIRGPFALCPYGTVKMGAKIYGDTTIGPYSKVGGEVSNSVVFGYSNKGHDGFLGNSVLGEWCNLGADTNTSNLKNNYGNVKVYSYSKNDFEDSMLQFCGLIMGDHSKSGINTMFNTGTSVGVSANVFGSGYPPKFIPSFTWGGINETTTFELEKALEVMQRVFERRNQVLTQTDKLIFEEIFKQTMPHRKLK